MLHIGFLVRSGLKFCCSTGLIFRPDKASRVIGKNDFVWEPFWLSDSEFLCVAQKENENDPSLYRMLLDGKNTKVLVKHARTPSASAAIIAR
jgi:hypothetical protein